MKLKNKKVLFFLLFAVVTIYSILPSFQTTLTESGERSDNDRQPPEKVMDSIGVKSGMIIGEIGAGRGRYTIHLAMRVGDKGKIFANDIREDSLSYLSDRCRQNGIENVETILGEVDDPLLPKNSLDMAIMVWVFHHLDKPVALLKNLKTSLKPGATVVILDPSYERSGEKDSDRPTTKARVEKEAEEAGFELVRFETFLPKDDIYILKAKIS